MADTPPIKVTVPTQIGKVRAPGQSYWVKFIGTPAVADGGSLGTGHVTAFCVDSENVYSFGGADLFCNAVKLNIHEPASGAFLLRVHNKTAYIWCNDGKMYALPLDPLGAQPVLIDFEGDGLLSNPITFVPAGTGWLLTKDDNGHTRLSKWTKVAGTNTLKTVTFTPQDGASLPGALTAIALVGQTLYVADESAIYSVAKVDDDYIASAVFAVPADWGGVAGMLGQATLYNDPAPDESPAFDRYLYVVAQDSGQIYLIYHDFQHHSDAGASAHDGNTSFGNLQLDKKGMLYFLKGTATGGISTVNVLNNKLFYLDNDVEAKNQITLLPNLLMGISPTAPMTIEFYDAADPSTLHSSLDLICQVAPAYHDGTSEYTRKFMQTVNEVQTMAPLGNPDKLTHGPALVFDFKAGADGNIIIGDILVDPHRHFATHHGQPS